MNRFCSWVTVVVVMFFAVPAAQAQRPMIPAFVGGIPGQAQMQAIVMQRHQVRTLLYREAIEELRKNPQAADVPGCPPAVKQTRTLCIRRPAAATRPTEAPAAMPASVPSTDVSSPSRTDLSTGRRRLAVLIGNNGYVSPIPELNTPAADVEKISEVLRTQFGYETRVLRDAGKAEIIHALNRIADEAKPEDSVLIFYAGHGYLMDDTKMGFWIPVDGSTKTAANWISNSDISKLLQAISARQLILVSDSCFSGSLTKEQKLSGSFSEKSAENLRRRAVLAFSSGDEEPVSDDGKGGHSIFAWHLINTLQAIKDAALGFEIYRVVHAGVKKDYPQEPQYGAVVTAGHEAGGEFLFDVRVQ